MNIHPLSTVRFVHDSTGDREEILTIADDYSVVPTAIGVTRATGWNEVTVVGNYANVVEYAADSLDIAGDDLLELIEVIVEFPA